MDKFRVGRVLLCGILIYTLVCLSSIPRYVGRNNPELASIFFPPWFNFDATYTSGAVLGFDVGLSKNQFGRAAVNKYENDMEVYMKCSTSAPDSTFIITKNNVNELLEITKSSDCICSKIVSRDISLFLYMDKNNINEIRIVFIRNEII